MISLKLRFRAAAICLAAILVLSILPSGQVYANDTGTDTEIEQTDPDQEQEVNWDASLEPADETEETSSASDDPDAAQDTAADELEVTPTASPAPDSAQDTASDEPETDTVSNDGSPDASSVDLDALTAWVQEHPEQLSALYAEDEETISALADALDTAKDSILACVVSLKSQNDILVQAMESGTDVLTTLSMSTSEDAAEALGVDVVAIDLFSIKLGYLSGLLSAAIDQAEEADQLDALMEELSQSLGDEETLSQMASRYDVEPAVLAAFLQSMGIEPIANTSSPSVSIDRGTQRHRRQQYVLSLQGLCVEQQRQR
jgi:hypothetical protein